MKFNAYCQESSCSLTCRAVKPSAWKPPTQYKFLIRHFFKKAEIKFKSLTRHYTKTENGAWYRKRQLQLQKNGLDRLYSTTYNTPMLHVIKRALKRRFYRSSRKPLMVSKYLLNPKSVLEEIHFVEIPLDENATKLLPKS